MERLFNAPERKDIHSRLRLSLKKRPFFAKTVQNVSETQTSSKVTRGCTQKIDQFLVTDVKIHSKLRLKFELIKLFTMKWNFSNVGNAN